MYFILLVFLIILTQKVVKPKQHKLAAKNTTNNIRKPLFFGSNLTNFYKWLALDGHNNPTKKKKNNNDYDRAYNKQKMNRPACILCICCPIQCKASTKLRKNLKQYIWSSGTLLYTPLPLSTYVQQLYTTIPTQCRANRPAAVAQHYERRQLSTTTSQPPLKIHIHRTLVGIFSTFFFLLLFG